MHDVVGTSVTTTQPETVTTNDESCTLMGLSIPRAFPLSHPAPSRLHETSPCSRGSQLYKQAIELGKNGAPHEAVNLLREAVHDLIASGDRRAAFLANNTLHGALAKLSVEELEAGRKTQARRYWAQAEDVAQELIESFVASEGTTVAHEALRVEQGEVGFSTIHPLGVDNLNECVGLAMRNTRTSMTSVAHIDRLNPPDSIQHVLSKLRQAPDDHIEARIVGARFGESTGTATSALLAATAHENTLSVLHAINEPHVEIISADVFDQRQPRSFVVDPTTFEICAAVPGAPHDYQELSGGMFALHSRPLRIAFDEAADVERGPLRIDPDEAAYLRYKFDADDPLHSPALAELPTPFTDGYGIKSYYFACRVKLACELDRATKELQRAGVSSVSTRPMYVGPGSLEANLGRTGARLQQVA